MKPMTNLMPYYVTRLLLVTVIGALLGIAGLPWWAALLLAGAMAALFLYAPHSGRYLVQDGASVAPLRRDERGERIVRTAARNAFVACALALAGASLYTYLAQGALVADLLVSVPLALGGLTYLVSDLWLRRA